MFENIIGHEKTIELLKNEILEKKIPGSILFEGPKYSGKMTLSLELSRILQCSNEAANWDCDCDSCRKNRLLINPDLLFLGGRDFLSDMLSASCVLKREKKDFAKFMFLRSARKLVRRFDPILWQEPEPKYKTALKIVSDIEAKLESFEPFHSDSAFTDKDIDSTVELCKKLLDLYNLNSINIDKIRSIISWSHISTPGKKKVVIIENIEKATESASNSLLKILEEPPKNIIFIATTTNRSKIMDTILSRLRRYYLPQRSAEEQKQVLARIFREGKDIYNDLNSYFSGWLDENHEALKQDVSDFLFKALEEPVSSPDFDKFENRIYFNSFLEELLKLCIHVMKGTETDIKLDLNHILKIKDIIINALSRYEEYNQSSKLLAESLFYSIKAIG